MTKVTNFIFLFSILSLILASSLASASIGSSLFSLDYSSPYDDFITAMSDSGTDDLNSVSSTETLTWENFDSKSILDDNEKNKFSLSFDPESSVFLVDDSNWLNVLKATTLAIHYESTLTSCKLSSCNGEMLPLKVSPLFILSSDSNEHSDSDSSSDSDILNIGSFLTRWSKDRAINLYSFGEISSDKKSIIEKDSSLSISELDSDLSDYLSQWPSSFSTVVIIPSSKEGDSLDYEVGLQATVIAGSLGVPLVSLDEKLKSKYFDSVKRVIVVGRNSGVVNLHSKEFKKYFEFAFDNDNIRELAISDVSDFVSKVNFLRPNVFGDGTYSLPLTHKRIVFNPEDISSSICSSNSNHCKDSLIVPYLALVHNQHLVSTKVASYLIDDGDSGDSSLITDSKKAISTSLTNFPVVDSSVPQYTTFVGSPAVLPLKYIDGFFPADLEILMKEKNLDKSSLSNLLGRGRLYADSREVLSSQVMSSLFLPLGTNSFVSIINNSESPDAFHVTSGASFYSSIFDNVSMFSSNNFSLTLINSSYRSSLSDSLAASVSSDILFLEDVSFDDDFRFESSPFTFLVKSNSTNVSCLDIISRGASACIGFENSFEASSKFKFLPQIYQYNYGSDVLFGDISSFIYRNYYLQRKALFDQLNSVDGSEEASSSSDDSDDFEVSYQQLILFGDPLVPFTGKNDDGLVQDKIKFNESKILPQRTYSFFDYSYVYFNSYFSRFHFISDDSFLLKQNYFWNELSPYLSKLIFPVSFSSGLSSDNYFVSLNQNALSAFRLSSKSFLDFNVKSDESRCTPVGTSEEDFSKSGNSLFNCQSNIYLPSSSDSNLFNDLILANRLYFDSDPSAFVDSNYNVFEFNTDLFHTSLLDDSIPNSDLVVNSKFNDGLFAFDGSIFFCLDPSVYEVPGSDYNEELKLLESSNKDLIISSLKLYLYSDNTFLNGSLILNNSSKKELILSPSSDFLDSLSLNFGHLPINHSVKSDLCFKSDLSSFDFINSNLSSFIFSHKETSLIDQLVFDVSFSTSSKQVSERFLSPEILALKFSTNSSSDLSIDYNDVNLDNYYISRGPLEIRKIDMSSPYSSTQYSVPISSPENFNFIEGQEYIVDKTHVFYVGDGTFFSYFLDKGYSLNSSGVYEGLTDEKSEFAKKLYYLSSLKNIYGVNLLNNYMLSSIHSWAISEADDPSVTSAWGQRITMHYPSDDDPDTYRIGSRGSGFKRGYDCIGFAASAIEIHFPKDYLSNQDRGSFFRKGHTFSNFNRLLTPFNFHVELFMVSDSADPDYFDSDVDPTDYLFLKINSSNDDYSLFKEALGSNLDDLNSDFLFPEIVAGNIPVRVFNSYADYESALEALPIGTPLQEYHTNLLDKHSYIKSYGSGTIEAHVNDGVDYGTNRDKLDADFFYGVLVSNELPSTVDTSPTERDFYETPLV